MRRITAKISFLILLAVTSVWPVLVAWVVAGQKGVQLGLMAYLALGGVLLMVLVVGGIRGILGS